MRFRSLVLTSLLLAATMTATADTDGKNPRVLLQTNLGPMVIELDAEKAPATVRNFLAYVDSGFYDGTIFHRVIKNFMIQGGGYDRSFQQKPTRPPIPNEANNGLKNLKGTVAMARTSNPHSATAQFFINVVDNPFLDHVAPNHGGWGYAVFGRVVSGMEVADKIRQLPTGAQGPFRQDVPKQMVIIEKAGRVEAPRPPSPPGAQ